VVWQQPVPVLRDGQQTPYVSFSLDTGTLGAGRFVLRLVHRSDERPADAVPGAVPFEVVAR